MKLADLSDLRTRVVELAKRSNVGKRVQDVTVEADEEDGEFLRIVVQLRDLEDVEAGEVEPLLRSIEDTVAQLDERFPSVRFAEAA